MRYSPLIYGQLGSLDLVVFANAYPHTIFTASVMYIDPVVSGNHIGASQLIESDWQHSYEKTASACSVYWFNNYEHRCRRGDMEGRRWEPMVVVVP